MSCDRYNPAMLTPAFFRLSAVMALLSALAFNAAAAAPQVPATPSEAGESPSAAIEHRSSTFQEMGVEAPLNVRGSDSAGLPFSLRRDRLVTAAKLTLAYNASPSLIPDVSHVKVLLNGEVFATLPLLPCEGGKTLEKTIPLDVRYFTDYNKLNFELVGRSSQD